MGGLQQLVVHDGETERCGGGGGNGTNRGAVLRSARAKEGVHFCGILGVGGGGRVVVVKKIEVIRLAYHEITAYPPAGNRPTVSMGSHCRLGDISLGSVFE